MSDLFQARWSSRNWRFWAPKDRKMAQRLGTRGDALEEFSMTGWRRVALACLIAAASAPARAEANWDACIAAPSRLCVLDLAAREVYSSDDPIQRATLRADLALAR